MSNMLRKVHNANATPNVRIKFCVILKKKGLVWDIFLYKKGTFKGLGI